MRSTRPVLLASLMVACGPDPATTATDSNTSDTGTGSVTTGDTPTSTTTPTGTATDSGSSSGDGGTLGATDSAATTEADTSTTGTTASTDPGTDTSTTSPVQTDTGPVETTSTGPDETTGTSTGPGETTGTSTGDETTGGDSTTGAVEACACPDLEVPLDDGIFVLSNNAELWKFFPENNQFQELGAIGCGLLASTFSMAVDRLGYAWVQYSDGKLRKVDVTDVSDCTDPGYTVGQMGITNFGMAFVSNSQFDACDRLYGNRYNGTSEGNAISDFFYVDPDTMKVGAIGKSNYGSAEVTGTGDGRAFFFGSANPAKLIEIDKATGKALSVVPLPNVEIGSAWAFAFFGGDFYFFTNSKGGPGSEVTHIDYDDSDNNGVKDIKTVVADAPISIVGAGVSTCAPLIPQ